MRKVPDKVREIPALFGTFFMEFLNSRLNLFYLYE